MGRHARVTEDKATAASAGLEKARASARECLGELVPASDVLSGCRAQERLLEAALLVEKGAAIMREVADELHRAVSAAASAIRPEGRPEKLVRWFSMSPEIQSRFVAVMSHLRPLGIEESRSLQEIADSLGLSCAEGQRKFQETDSYLRSMWKVNMLARSTDEAGRPSYALSVEARALLDSGAFAGLGLPAATA